MSKWRNSLLLAVILSLLAVPLPAQAQAELAQRTRFQVSGVIRELSTAASSLSLETRWGEVLEIAVSTDTVFRSAGAEVEGLSDLEVGWHALIRGHYREDDPVASLVAVADPTDFQDLGRARGEIATIDLSAETFSLETRAGETLQLEVTDETRFLSPLGQLEGLSDLQVGTGAAVIYREGAAGRLAQRVVVRPGEDRGERRIVRMAGEITALGEGYLTIESNEGDPITFTLTDRTRIRVRGGLRLAVAMRARVLGYGTGDERPVAVVVSAGPGEGLREASEIGSAGARPAPTGPPAP